MGYEYKGDIKCEISEPKANGVNRCATCKHWDSFKRKNRLGEEVSMCILSKMRDAMMYAGRGLFTREDFGCILHEAK